MKLASLALCLCLGACAHEVVLTPADGIGPMGRGTAPATLVSYHGAMVVELAGKHYAGEWTLQSDGGFIGGGIGAVDGKVASATAYGMSTSGNGRAYLTEPGGGSISCAFSFNSMSYSGVGECRTEAGKAYNMMIH